MKRLITLLSVVSLFYTSLSAQSMFDYSDIKYGRFEQKTVTGLRSMNDGEHYTVISENRIEKYSYKTGELTAVLFDVKKAGGQMKDFSDYEFNADETKILLTTNVKPIYRRSYTADHYIFDVPSSKLWKLSADGAEQVPVFSPDGTKVGFVRENNIYYITLTADGPSAEVAVTTDGNYNSIINGHADWVYEEEFGFTRAYFFSPDSRRIAYMRFDESDVKEVVISRFLGGLYPEPMVFKYPKAGERNSVVEVKEYEIASGQTTIINVGPEKDQYIPYMGWTPANEVFCYRLNRLQNHFDLLVADNSGSTKIIYSESHKRYIERLTEQTVNFMPKSNRFIVMNETSGYNHLYMYDRDKGLVDTLTKGNWEVKEIVELTKDRIYYLSNEGSPLRNNLYSVRLNGKGKTHITNEKGTYKISPSNGFKYFISYFSNVSTPNMVRLHNSSGKVLRMLEDNQQLRKTIADVRLPIKEFFTFTTERGTSLNGYIIKPRGFDESKTYPVMMTQYSGPGSQEVIDKWSIDWTDVLAQENYIVVCVDGRGTGGRGADFRKVTYGNLGGFEMEDQISAAKYMASQKYVDADRIGIYGWSFGGFMALNCILKGNDVFKLAIAVAPVTSWRFYDTIYTEVYNGLPQDNPQGYDDNSPINYAELLKGKLLLMHGSADDNVHPQNAFRMVEALVKADKKFDMMIYPDANHSMVPVGNHHIREKMIDYTVDNL